MKKLIESPRTKKFLHDVRTVRKSLKRLLLAAALTDLALFVMFLCHVDVPEPIRMAVLNHQIFLHRIL